MRYELKYADHLYNTDDLTGHELQQVEKASGTAWSLLSPFERISDLMALLGVFLVRDYGEEGALEILDGDSLTLGELKSMVTPFPDEFDAVPFVVPPTSS